MGMHITFIPMLTAVNITPHGCDGALFCLCLRNNNPSNNKLMGIYEIASAKLHNFQFIHFIKYVQYILRGQNSPAEKMRHEKTDTINELHTKKLKTLNECKTSW